MPAIDDHAKAAWNTLAAVRTQAPLVHSVTNLVVTNLTANVLLALGASPAMVENVEEAGELAAVAGSLVINLGSMSAARTEAMQSAVLAADRNGTPWVLDPVAVGALSYRSEVARGLLAHRPTVIRGNASEIFSLAGGDGGGKGVDSTLDPEAAVGAAQRLARSTGCVVAVTGKIDRITDGDRLLEVRNGHQMQTRVTGMGCSATAVIAACLAATRTTGFDRLATTTQALALFGLAAEHAAVAAAGPASFQVALIDALFNLDEARTLAGVRISPPPSESRPPAP
ncbi:hydroxyethylthiazole kinase [alpha proteobacterium BAL199]|jgi:hydroxyethylthiazole kinase|nr:hydroxyethylthiazole kinase [alpha proteobacterium BAL199]